MVKGTTHVLSYVSWDFQTASVILRFGLYSGAKSKVKLPVWLVFEEIKLSEIQMSLLIESLYSAHAD